MQTLIQIALIHWLSALMFITIGSYSLFKKIKWGWYFLLAGIPMIVIPFIFNARLEGMFSFSQGFGFNAIDSFMAMFTMGVVHAPVGLIMLLNGIIKIKRKQEKQLGVILVISGSALLVTFIDFLIRFQIAMG